MDQLRRAVKGIVEAQTHEQLGVAGDTLASAAFKIGLDAWPRFLGDSQRRAMDAVSAEVIPGNVKASATGTDTAVAGGALLLGLLYLLTRPPPSSKPPVSRPRLCPADRRGPYSNQKRSFATKTDAQIEIAFWSCHHASVASVWQERSALVRSPDKDHAGVEGVSAAERALQVLTAFRRGDGAVSLAELAERTGLVKSTIMRLAVSLQRFRLLARLADGSYRLDAEALRLGTAYQQAFSLADHVTPALERLADATGETASFYVRHGNERLCLFRVESTNQIRMHVQPGDLRPLDQSASARILSVAGDRFPADMELPLFTSGASNPDAASLAMPVFGIGQEMAGVIMISGPVSRLTVGRARELRPVVAEAAARLSRACGGEPLRPAPPASAKAKRARAA